MKFAQALRAAKALGYTGAETPDALQAWLAHADQADAAVTIGTKTYKANDIKLETEAKSARTAVLDEPPPEQKGRGGLDELPSDFQAKVEATAKAMLEKAGLIDTSGKAKHRPGMIGPNDLTIGTVKSMPQRIYEDRIKAGQAKFTDWDNAYGFQKWLGSIVCSWARNDAKAEQYRKQYHEWCERKGIDAKAMTTTSPTSAGPLVPDMFVPDLIRNVNEVGDCTRLVTPFAMGAQEIQFPRRTAGHTAYFQQEAVTVTQTAPTYDNVSLKCQTLMALTLIAQQLLDDSNVSVMDKVMEELTYAMADKRDGAFFVGDGTETYGGMTGIARKFGVTATDAARVKVGATTSNAHTIEEIELALALLPRYAWSGATKITCHQSKVASIFNRLSKTAGGLLKQELVNGQLVTSWGGIPIIVNNYMNSRNDASAGTHPTGFTAGDDIDFIVGNWDRTCLLGQRMEIELAADTSRGFDVYGTYVRAVMRFDVNHYDASTTTGGLVAFWQT